MVLFSVYVTDYYISSALYDQDKKVVIDTVYLNLPYQPNFYESKISSKKLESILIGVLKKLKIDPDKVNPFNINNTFDVLVKDYPSNIIPVDYTTFGKINLEKNDLNDFQNLKGYHKKVPLNLRIKAESKAVLDKLVKTKYFQKQNYTLDITTLNLDAKDKENYINLMLQNLLQAIEIDGVYKFSFDFKFCIVPILGALKESGVSAKEYLENNQCLEPVKMIFLKNLTSLKISKGNRVLKFDLTSNKLTKLDVLDNEKIDVFWQAENSKFNGEIYGAKYGIYLYHYER